MLDYPAWSGFSPQQRSELSAAMHRALAAQVAGDLDLARTIYEAVVTQAPDTFDAQHMLGVICHQQGQLRQSYERIRRALDSSNWQVDAMRRNLDLLVESLLARNDENLLPATRRVDARMPMPALSPTRLPASPLTEPAAGGEPLITAIVSTYASAAFIDECLQDLVSQTVFSRMEVVVVDACSPEDEAAVVESYRRRYPNIRYIRTPTRIGVYAAWNLAIREARGRYLTPFSTNDRLRPEAYALLSRALEDNPEVAVVYGDTILTRVPHQTFADHTPSGAMRWNRFAFEDLTAQCSVGPHPMWRRSLHREFGYFDEQYKALSDQEFWLRVGERLPMLHIAETTGLYWDTPDALSQDGDTPKDEWATIQGTYRGRYLSDLDEWRRRVGRARDLPWETAMYVARFGAPPTGPFGSQALSAARRDGRLQRPFIELPSAGDPLVSVVVSTFNAAAGLAACLVDLEQQTIADSLEIIVVDSGSLQNEQEVVRQFESRLPRLVYVRTERETLYSAWNRGIALARGRYVTNANTDDAHRPDALEQLVAALETYPEAEVAYGDYAWTERANDSFAAPRISRTIRHPEFHPADALFYCVLGCHPLWRRSMFGRLGGFDGDFKAVGDYDMLLRMIIAGGRPVHVAEVLSLFHQNPDGLSLGSTQARQEFNAVQARRRKEMPIERIFAVDPSNRQAVASAWTALGARAMRMPVPWLDHPVADVDYAKYCFSQALAADPGQAAAAAHLRTLADLPAPVQIGDRTTRLPHVFDDVSKSFEAPPVPPAHPPLRWGGDSAGNVAPPRAQLSQSEA